MILIQGLKIIYRGILELILKNSTVATANLVYICTFLAKLDEKSTELNELARQVVFEFKNNAKDQWDKLYENLPKDLKTTLQDRFF